MEMYILPLLNSLQNIIVMNYGLLFFLVNDLLGDTWPQLNIEVQNLVTFYFKSFLNDIIWILILVEKQPLDGFLFFLCEGICLFHIWDLGRDLFLDVRNSTWFVQFFRTFSNIYYNFGFHYLSDIIVGSFVTYLILLHMSRDTYL